MSKILEIFSERHKKGQIYRNVPVRKDDNIHPLNYVYPDTQDSVTEDLVFGEESVSLTRDIDRIKKFEETHAGARFLDKQIVLQRTNTFEYTRNYRKDNLKDHVDPTVVKPRHGYKISTATGATAVSIPGEFTFVTGDVGKLQGETADKLVSSSGPVYLRLSSKEGMMNTGGLTYLDLAAAHVRRRAAGWINDLLEPWSSPIGQARARIFGTAATERPENETGYLEQIFNQNKALQRPDGGRFGHVYLSLSSQDESGTYRETFGTPWGRGGPIDAALSEDSVAPGFSTNLQSLRAKDFTIVNFSIDRGFQSIVRTISQRIQRKVRNVVSGVVQASGFNKFSKWVTGVTGGRVRLPNPSRSLADYIIKFLPRLQDITFLRHLKRFAVDIDNVIENINNRGSALQTSDWDASNIRMRYYGSRAEEEANKTVEVGTEHLVVRRDMYNSYIDALKDYKSKNKTISIGFADEGNTTQVDGKDVFKAHNYEYANALARGKPNEAIRKPGYYKDWMQADNPSIYRDRDSRYDSDSIDVIMKVMGRPADHDVRFRAFIQDIVETVTPTYNENKYIGRYETVYTYDRVVRDVTFSLRLHAFSLDERDVVMQKMAYLTSLAYPESSGGSGPGYLTPLMTEVTIGRLYVKQPCLVQTLTHTIENDVSWDIDQQTPMSIAVNMTVRLLDKKLYTHQGMGNDQFTLYLTNAWDNLIDDPDRDSETKLAVAHSVIDRWNS